MRLHLNKTLRVQARGGPNNDNANSNPVRVAGQEVSRDSAEHLRRSLSEHHHAIGHSPLSAFEGWQGAISGLNPDTVSGTYGGRNLPGAPSGDARVRAREETPISPANRRKANATALKFSKLSGFPFSFSLRNRRLFLAPQGGSMFCLGGLFCFGSFSFLLIHAVN